MLCNDKLLLSISFVLDTTLAINTDERLNNATTGNTHGEETYSPCFTQVLHFVTIQHNWCFKI